MTLSKGTIIGDRYRVLAHRANGASGSVYEAEHEGLNKIVALKVVHANLASSVLVGRFFREARILTTLDHPNVVRALDVGVDPSVGAFMALEYVEGEDLESRLGREPRLEVEQALRIAHDIAMGVAAVHSARIIHRDLKPANVLLERNTGRAKVTDFGVARIRDDLRQLDLNGAVTEFEMAVGTPQYMAPEQVASPHEVDDRTDVFALGAILFEMLSGRPAFDTPRLERLLRDVLLRKAPSLGTCGVPLPPNIVNLVDAMLAPAPEYRPKSIAEVARELENVFAVKRSVPPPSLAAGLAATSRSAVPAISFAPESSAAVEAARGASSFPPVTHADEEAHTERAPIVVLPGSHIAARNAKRFLPASAYVAMACLALGGFALGRTTLPRAGAQDVPPHAAYGTAPSQGVLLPQALPPAPQGPLPSIALTASAPVPTATATTQPNEGQKPALRPSRKALPVRPSSVPSESSPSPAPSSDESLIRKSDE
ncbi:MAG: protein kinase [Polyangiaceae bacterium]